MEESRRLAYLSALGIDVWCPKYSQTKAKAPDEILEQTSSAVPVPQQTGEPLRPVVQVEELSFEALRESVNHCTQCGLHKTRRHAVFGSGHAKSDLMIVGEAPGADEDQQGEPFVGKAGQLLTQMLRAIGLAREEVFICNILKCRPPNNRDPQLEEVAACRTYLDRQIVLVEPQLILAVGRVAAQSLLGVSTPVGKLRGKKYTIEPHGLPLIVTYHPAYLLRSPKEKRKAWDDLKVVRNELVRRDHHIQ